MRVLNFGSLNIDYVYPVDHIIIPGETEPTGEVTANCGGKGLNQSIALARAGVEVCHAGLIGEEGQLLADKLVENGVDTSHVRRIPGRSGHTIIQVDKNGQNSILLFGGANRRLTYDIIDETLSDFGEGDILLLQNEVNLLDVIIDKAFEARMKIILNPSPYDTAIQKCDLSKVSVFILNEIEGEQMTGKKEPGEILDAIKSEYPCAKTVLTLGSSGAVYQDGESRYSCGICRVKPVDTTAAGDTFTGYFISAMIDTLSPEDGLRLASKASAIAVTRNGAADSIPKKEEVTGSGMEPEPAHLF